MTLNRLHPDTGATTVAEQVERLCPWDEAPTGRPRVLTNFALTLDGRATLGGTSGRIGSDTDTAMLVGLRTRVDAVMIGGGTMRAEGYGRVVGDPAKRELREANGLTADPLMVIVSGRMDLPWDAPLFTDGVSKVLIVTTSEADPPETANPVELDRHEGTIDLALALRKLRAERNIRGLLCEGGPRLHAQLIEAGLVDELFVTHAAKLGGGDGPGLVNGLAEGERRLTLDWLLHETETGELFARYLR